MPDCGTCDRDWFPFRPPQLGLADHLDPGRSFQRLQNPVELLRPERTIVLNHTRREVDQAERSVRRPKSGFQDVRVGKIALDAQFAARRSSQKPSAAL